jgi:ubiquinone/menaquinone biosynthesis C-methylase UbiE
MASALAAATRITATDLNQPMLDLAAAKLARESRVEWRQADALALPFESESFDAVVCQFGAMFFPDKVQGYNEARRVLGPGGRFFFSVWDRISENEFAEVVTRALAEIFPEDPPGFLARTPHGYHDAERIRQELNAAGFTDISIEPVEARSRASSPSDPAIGYCQGTPLRNEVEARGGPNLERATRHAAEALARRFGTGAVDGRIRALVITATR